ncbi:NUDIX domain-containing protein [Candidatus Micrarchaeota archaeon]|nr:NUDIX domain-containing protein [Candidatus Micrarchaeota archaeon]MBU1930199.1 NUDIX domain-containing protein [Candidatus Micrarchaeota archaeon]
MANFRLAAKGFILNENKKLLVVKRSNYTKQKPGIWELPGGRLEPGENPINGVQREIKEETGLEINVLEPISVRHFKRVDKQTVTLLIFLCELKSGTIQLSNEHDSHNWIDPLTEKHLIAEFYHPELETYQKRYAP